MAERTTEARVAQVGRRKRREESKEHQFKKECAKGEHGGKRRLGKRYKDYANSTKIL